MAVVRHRQAQTWGSCLAFAQGVFAYTPLKDYLLRVNLAAVVVPPEQVLLCWRELLQARKGFVRIDAPLCWHWALLSLDLRFNVIWGGR